MQLLDLPDDRLPAPDRAREPVPPGQGCGRPDDLYVQYWHGAAPVLPALRHQVVLRAALEPGRVQHQRALPRPGHDRAAGHRALRWPELGGVGGCAARAFARIGRLPPEAPCAVRRRGSAEVVAAVRAAPGRWTRRDSPTRAARHASVPSAVRRVVPWRARPDGAPAAAATYQSTPRQKSPAGKSAKESSFPNSDQLRRCPLCAPFPCLYASLPSGMGEDATDAAPAQSGFHRDRMKFLLPGRTLAAGNAPPG